MSYKCNAMSTYNKLSLNLVSVNLTLEQGQSNAPLIT